MVVLPVRTRRVTGPGTLMAAGALALVLGACTTGVVARTGPSTSGSVAVATSLAPVTTETTVPVTTTTFPAAFDVGIRTITVVDTTRPTFDFATTPPSELEPYRAIEAEIRYPTTSGPSGTEQRRAVPALQFGPFPVIVFAHGYGLMPDTYEQLLDAWVRAGFVVVSPVFPVTNYYEWVRQGGGPAPEYDMRNQPADVAFVVGQLAARAAQDGSFLHGLLDLRRLGLAGQSDGATTMGALVYAQRLMGSLDSLAFPPVAVALLSGAELQQEGEYAVPPAPAPAVLAVQSDADQCNSPAAASALYSAVAPGSTQHWFMTLENAQHLGPYEGEMPWAPVVASVTTDFFELELGGRQRPVTADTLTSAGSDNGVSTMSTATNVTLAATSGDQDCGPLTPTAP